jgi:hypothetical protein
VTVAPPDVLPWLLEPDDANPGVRYFALRHLLDRPWDDPDVIEARAAIMRTGPVPAILAKQHAGGYWEKPGPGYATKYRGTVWQVIQLDRLGADPTDARVRAACEYVLRHTQSSNGGFGASSEVRDPPPPSRALHCLNGNLLAALLHLGWLRDERVQHAIDWQALSITGEDPDFRYYSSTTAGPGFVCGINDGQPCAWGADKAIRALLAIPPESRTAAVTRALEIGADFLLSRDPADADYPYSNRVSGKWFRFGLPLSYQSDVLETVENLVDLGYGADSRLDRAFDLILSKRDGQGRWPLEDSLNGRTWTRIEAKGKPSKWVTLRALRTLRKAGRS